jgi:CheY-like chemotaxis protein
MTDARRTDSDPPPKPTPHADADGDGAASLIASIHETGELLDAVLREARLYARAWRAREDPPSSKAPYRVLLVDDDDALRAVYEAGLRASGLHVWTAAGAVESIPLARARNPDVIVMDYSMPGADGGQGVRLLAEDPRLHRIPVVMMTAYVDLVPVDTRTRCVAVIAKPCAADELAYLLRLVVETANPRSQRQP